MVTRPEYDPGASPAGSAFTSKTAGTAPEVWLARNHGPPDEVDKTIETARPDMEAETAIRSVFDATPLLEALSWRRSGVA
jgi:hypothetical protein